MALATAERGEDRTQFYSLTLFWSHPPRAPPPPITYRNVIYFDTRWSTLPPPPPPPLLVVQIRQDVVSNFTVGDKFCQCFSPQGVSLLRSSTEPRAETAYVNDLDHIPCHKDTHHTMTDTTWYISTTDCNIATFGIQLCFTKLTRASFIVFFLQLLLLVFNECVSYILTFDLLTYLRLT